MSIEALNAFWSGRLQRVKAQLEENNFSVWTARDVDEAKSVFWEEIFSKVQPASVSFGGSMTVVNSGLHEELKQRDGLEVIDTYDTSLPLDEFVERRRRALLVDLYLTGTNAVTGDGHLVNLDGLGNRVAAMTFGPKHVALLIGRNKIVPDLESSVDRIKQFAAPANAVRLDRKTPCAKSMQCEDCSSPERICNVWSITEKSNPPERIKIVLINQDLGY
jgi:L-lactate utilization protein LutB